jgi:hypothetical protein
VDSEGNSVYELFWLSICLITIMKHCDDVLFYSQNQSRPVTHRLDIFLHYIPFSTVAFRHGRRPVRMVAH